MLPRPTGDARTVPIDYVCTARININAPFEAYWKARGKNLRHTIRRQRNRLAREAIRVKLELLTEMSQMAGAVADFGRLESAGWKGKTGTAVGVGDKQARFYKAVLETFSTRGKSLVFRYWYDDNLVATDLCIHHEGSLIILKTTYDERQRTTSPAHLMRYEAFQRLFGDSRFKKIEFYGRAMGWHTKWCDEMRMMYHINIYRWPFVARLHRRRQVNANECAGNNSLQAAHNS